MNKSAQSQRRKPSLKHLSDDEDADRAEEAEDLVFEEWTENEIGAGEFIVTLVLRHYEVDSLEPDSWSDHEEEESAVKSNSNINFFSKFNPLAMQQTKKVVLTNDAADISDPLAINEQRYKETRKTFEKDIRSSAKSVIITSKSFDPVTFLLQTHRTASFKELEKGISNLKISIQQRNELLKNLVKTHFAKFVSAKSTIDAFYDEMRTQNLVSSDDYGIAPYNRVLLAAQNEANALYGPMLERRERVSKIRGALAVFEKWRFFFSLPSLIQENIIKRNYDSIVQDYKKAKYLMETMMNQEKSENPSDSVVPESYQQVFNKVWDQVLDLVSQVRDELLDKLQDSSASIESQEKVIEYLIALDETQDPCWFYLNNQYHHIMDEFTTCYDDFRLIMEKLVHNDRNKRKTATNSDKNSINYLKRLLNAVYDKGFGDFGDSLDVSAWQAYEKMVETMAHLIYTKLPGFWKISRMFSVVQDDEIEAKRKYDNNRLQVCLKMLKNIHEQFTMSIGMPFFQQDSPQSNSMWSMLSADNSNYQKRGRVKFSYSKSTENLLGGVARLPRTSITGAPMVSLSDQNNFVVEDAPGCTLLPPEAKNIINAHPLISGYYMRNCFEMLNHMFKSVKQKKVGGNSMAQLVLAPLMEGLVQLRDHSVEHICFNLSKEISNFYLYENWHLISANDYKITQSVQLAYRFIRFMIKTLYGVAGTDISLDNKFNEKSKAKNLQNQLDELVVNPKNTNVIQTSIFKSLESFLDGMQWLVVNWSRVETENYWKLDSKAVGSDFYVVIESADNAQTVAGWSAAARNRGKWIDENLMDTRALITISNLKYFKDFMLPKVIQQFETKFQTLVFSEKQTLEILCDSLDSILFQNFIKFKSSSIFGLLDYAILKSGLDWNDLSKLNCKFYTNSSCQTFLS